MIEGVRTSSEGLVCEGIVLVRRGRKFWRVRTGLRSRVLRRSERVVGERVATGEDG